MFKKLLHTLASCAYDIEASKVITCNAMSVCKSTNVHTIVFPECGSGYHEWTIVCELIKQGHHIDQVVFMDSMIGDNKLPSSQWLQCWKCMATELNINILTFTSYIELAHWANNTHATVFVIYINGSFKFGPSYCGPNDCEECRLYACHFWEWCSKHCANQLGNIVRDRIVQPDAVNSIKSIIPNLRKNLKALPL